MKKSNLLLVLSSFLALSCNNDFVEESNQNVIDADYLRIIDTLGFDVSSAIDMGDHFIVEGDIMIMKEELPNYKKVATRQAYANYTVRDASDFRINKQ